MSAHISDNTKAILLLAAPLLVGKKEAESVKVLTPTEYNKLAELLIQSKHTPSELLGSGRSVIFEMLNTHVDVDRLSALLDRGFLMSQAIDQWQSRGIWIISRADPEYPARLKSKLKKYAPPLIYGCGDSDLLTKGGLAVVGSRKIDDAILKFTHEVGALTAGSGNSIVSGGARGVDRAAMDGALNVDGTAVGVLAENLSRMAVSSEWRKAIKENRLVLISAVDPNARFNVGNAMQRNKFIYALADVGLVINSDYKKGGTWTGAVEQLDRFKCCPVFVRVQDDSPKGNKELAKKGAIPWPAIADSDDLRKLVAGEYELPKTPSQDQPALNFKGEIEKTEPPELPPEPEKKDAQAPDSEKVEDEAAVQKLEDFVLELINDYLSQPRSKKDVGEYLGVSPSQAGAWLEIFVERGLIEKNKRPVSYQTKSPSLFKD